MCLEVVFISTLFKVQKKVASNMSKTQLSDRLLNTLSLLNQSSRTSNSKTTLPTPSQKSTTSLQTQASVKYSFPGSFPNPSKPCPYPVVVVELYAYYDPRAMTCERKRHRRELLPPRLQSYCCPRVAVVNVPNPLPKGKRFWEKVSQFVIYSNQRQRYSFLIGWKVGWWRGEGGRCDCGGSSKSKSFPVFPTVSSTSCDAVTWPLLGLEKVKAELECRNDDAVDDGRNNNSLARVNKMLSNFVMYEGFFFLRWGRKANVEVEWEEFYLFWRYMAGLLIKFSEKKS